MLPLLLLMERSECRNEGRRRESEWVKMERGEEERKEEGQEEGEGGRK